MIANGWHIRIVILGCSLAASPALAWNEFGHMEVAAIAWEQMSPAAMEQATQLLKLNPEYNSWIKGVAAMNRDKFAFMIAATWPDIIKGKNDYQNDGAEGGNVPPSGPAASQNIG